MCLYDMLISIMCRSFVRWHNIRFIKFMCRMVKDKGAMSGVQIFLLLDLHMSQKLRFWRFGSWFRFCFLWAALISCNCATVKFTVRYCGWSAWRAKHTHLASLEKTLYTFCVRPSFVGELLGSQIVTLVISCNF